MARADSTCSLFTICHPIVLKSGINANPIALIFHSKLQCWERQIGLTLVVFCARMIIVRVILRAPYQHGSQTGASVTYRR